MNNPTNRIIGFLDMDSFEVQIYLKEKYPDADEWIYIYQNQPCILVDPTTYSDRIVSVSPLAKSYGICREGNIQQAKNAVDDAGDDLLIIPKDVRFNKPESRLLRNASLDVRHSIVTYRRNSINIDKSEMQIFYSPSDEFYIDLTQEINNRTTFYRIAQQNFPWKFNAQGFGQNTRFEDTGTLTKFEDVLAHINCRNGNVNENYLYEFKLLMAGIMIQEFRETVLEKTGFFCSGGVAENKTLAKFACPLNKPRGTTILTRKGYQRLVEHTAITELKGLGSDIRELLNGHLSINQEIPLTIKQLQSYDIYELQRLGISHEKAISIYNLAHGICQVRVEEKLMSNQITVGKTNYNNLFIENCAEVKEAVWMLMQEMFERLHEEKIRNYRIVKSIKVSIDLVKQSFPGFSIALNGDFEQRNPNLEMTYVQWADHFDNNLAGGFCGKVEKISLSSKPISFQTYD